MTDILIQLHNNLNRFDDESIEPPVKKRLIISTTPNTLVYFDHVKYPNGEWYQGHLKGGKREGKGKYFNKNGSIRYEGDFCQDMREGNGKCFDNNGVLRYEGQMKSNYGEGNGKLYSCDALIIFEGNFKKGKMEGFGKHYNYNLIEHENASAKIIYADYVGHFENNQRTRVGRAYFQNGAMREEYHQDASEKKDVKSGFRKVLNKFGEIIGYENFNR